MRVPAGGDVCPRRCRLELGWPLHVDVAAARPYHVVVERGPGFKNVDLMSTRRVPPAGGTGRELCAEAYNLLNTAPLGNPNAGAANFGTITTAGDPRVIQLALTFLF